MLTRREMLSLFGCLAVAPRLGARETRSDVPRLAPGAPGSAERLALIADFRKRSEGLEQRFERRVHEGDWDMPYRLFRPTGVTGEQPLVVYLHGSGGLGNVFGTRVWALPENQRQFPCYVAVPQTDRGWARYDPTAAENGAAVPVAGLGDGSRLALEIVDALRREFPIDDRRIYVTGQSMGGAGVWNMLAHRPNFFAAAVICCPSTQSKDDGTSSISTAAWVFQGESDETVPPAATRARVAERRKAGGEVRYTEYPGVGHNVWQWAYTEPELPGWMFARRRAK